MVDMADPKPLRVGDPVTVQSAALGERTGIVRGFRLHEDEDAPLVIVDLDPKVGGKATPSSLMGWLFREHQVTRR
jgi:hypothetical protein